MASITLGQAAAMTLSPDTSGARTILFAGGGTGGHIFPSLAIVDRLRERGARAAPHFAVSARALDAQIMAKHEMAYTPLPARPASMRPWDWPAFGRAWLDSVGVISRLIDERRVGAVVAMGGFVAAPAVAAAKKRDVPVLLVNLDAVPGRANRLMARHATEIFSAYPTPALPHAQRIGLPLRRSAIGPADKFAAREQLGLEPERDVLLVTGASQGAQSINRLMLEMVTHAQPRRAMGGWQVLHLSGGTPAEAEEVRTAYKRAGLAARVETFCNAMGLAWAAATIAISRAGAGSVAEVWANGTPTIFLPYPYHKDQHQRLNAEPLTRAGAALMFKDLIDPVLNAKQVAGPLMALMSNTQRRVHMAELMRDRLPPDGADVVAAWLMKAVG